MRISAAETTRALILFLLARASECEEAPHRILRARHHGHALGSRHGSASGALSRHYHGVICVGNSTTGDCDDDPTFDLTFEHRNIWTGSGVVAVMLIFGIFLTIWNLIMGCLIAPCLVSLLRDRQFKPSIVCICPHWILGIVAPFLIGGIALFVPTAIGPYAMAVRFHWKYNQQEYQAAGDDGKFDGDNTGTAF